MKETYIRNQLIKLGLLTFHYYFSNCKATKLRIEKSHSHLKFIQDEK